MDDWKKVYSNEDTAAVAVPYFWENFDKENYSVWYSEYKYPEDLKMVFMSCNLVSGKTTLCSHPMIAQYGLHVLQPCIG